ncbi:bifunctional adenosylcobinamide kinase/adenosylcobinamide-phosphate guanylyltransferase [Pseudoduganella lutea]|uniref:Bifunctional adenosylcobalamin biosynthesis protein n=1 Tax=Pseudoduganella lutea TaxID=321985 RepID=A0A4V0Z3E2_9BURK|nr:bifunctional adenosylcobinamide kinase/adenosylcobinamide-phosphate guanylyltransferase [Pseudoduganella lutea]QBE63133.1 bifunctional adenosylcobinamide kinase/adenosylcobinamide-phosphate guanylyltransferase [Pseudoduganella lutea]
MSRTLVLGGARSGKSAHAERLAAQSGKEIVYVATAGAGDTEMAQRIALHRAGRPAGWTTVEEPLALAAVLGQWRAPHRLVLVDCLTLWLTNLLFADGTEYPDVGTIALPRRFHDERAALLAQLEQNHGDVVFVSNEVGMGIVPFGAVTRAFADEAGRLNQAVAAACDNVVFVAAGLPLVLKGAPC